MYQLLIVDDEASVVESLAGTIPWHELEIETVFKAYSGQEALDLLHSRSIDIVITDIRMPGISGMELLKAIRQRFPRTKAILLSGHSEFEYAKEAIVNHAADYLLKPVRDDDLMSAVSRVIGQIRLDWADIASYQRAVSAFRENLPTLRADLLKDLLTGRKLSGKELTEKLSMLGLSQFDRDRFSLLLIRLEEEFAGYDKESLSLFEFAIQNMAEEIFQPDFDLWPAKDRHDYLVFLVMPARELDQPLQRLENAAAQLQKAIATYLKGTVSLVASPWGVFPDQVRALYDNSVASLRRRVGAEREFFITWKDDSGDSHVNNLQSLYEPPALQHLLEAGRWDAAEEKLAAIFAELEQRFSGSLEHLLEAFYSIASSLSYIAHKNGRHLETIITKDFALFAQSGALQSVGRLKEWTLSALQQIRFDMEKEVKDTRTSVVKQVQEYVEENLSGNVSLQAIADHVHLHPVYLSKVYKLETGEALSEYLVRYRMSQAAHLLKNTEIRIYEIAQRLGYTYTPYFIKVFKKQFGQTPQEFRDSK